MKLTRGNLLDLVDFGHVVYVVEAGTKIDDIYGGEPLKVTETNAVFKGRKIYCTQAIYDKLKERCIDATAR